MFSGKNTKTQQIRKQTEKKMQNKEYLKSKKGTLGYIDYNKGCYISYRNENHFFYKFNGFGVSVKLLDYLTEKNINRIIINYLDREIYFAYTDDFIVKGDAWTDGNDEQLILNLKHWRKKIKDDRQICLHT